MFAFFGGVAANDKLVWWGVAVFVLTKRNMTTLFGSLGVASPFDAEMHSKSA